MSKGNDREFFGLDLQNSQIGFRVAADDPSFVGAAVIQRNLDVIGCFNNVVVGQDIAVGADDNAGAKPGVALRLAFRTLTKKVAENRIVQ